MILYSDLRRNIISNCAVLLAILVALATLFHAIQLIPFLLNAGFTLYNFSALLTLYVPKIFILVLPITFFGAILLHFRRLLLHNELQVFYTLRLSPLQILRPIIMVSWALYILIVLAKLYIAPAAQHNYVSIKQDISSEVIGNFLSEGRFVSPAKGLTIFVRKKTSENSVSDIFLVDERKQGTRFVISARKGIILSKHNQHALLLLTGSQQEWKNGKVQTVYFNRYSIDITELGSNADTRWVKPNERSPNNIIHYLTSHDTNDRHYAALTAELVDRFSFALLIPALTLLAGALILSPTSGRQDKHLLPIIAGVIGCLSVVISYLSFRNLANDQLYAVTFMVVFPIIIMAASYIYMQLNYKIFFRKNKNEQ